MKDLNTFMEGLCQSERESIRHWFLEMGGAGKVIEAKVGSGHLSTVRGRAGLALNTALLVQEAGRPHGGSGCVR